MGGKSKSKGKALKASRKTVQKAAISTAAKIAGGGMAGIAAAKTMAAVQEKGATAKKAGKKEKKKKTILRTLGEIGERKVKSDIEKGEKLLRKGMGAITVFNIAAETAKEYMDKLEAAVMALGEGLKTGSVANINYSMSQADRRESFIRKQKEILMNTTVTMVQANERDLQIQMQIMTGVVDAVIESVEDNVELVLAVIGIGEALVSYVAGENPNFIDNLVEAVKEIIVEEGGKLAHPIDTFRKMIEDQAKAVANSTPEEQGKVIMGIVLAMIGPAAVKKAGKIIKKVYKKVHKPKSTVIEPVAGLEVSRQYNVSNEIIEQGRWITNFNCPDDPIREILGRGMDSNPEDWSRIIKELEDSGVEIVYREGVMGYSPHPSTNGKPGQFLIDPNASISALDHEYLHFKQAENAGFPNMRGAFEDSEARIANETASYAVEIQRAQELGLDNVVEQLKKNLQREINTINTPLDWP